ncbi:MAG TPA: endonuclease MutS2 [Candidatus Kapabacteria bacterium]|nr:endonuclease MutS2 [Candidatus Kapabacteria bacterium]
MMKDELIRSSLEQLEFGRILEHIAGYAASSLGVEHVSELEPLSDENAVREELRMVGEIRAMLQRDQLLPLDGIYDIREALAVARIRGAWLSGENLLHCASTLASMRKIREFFAARREACPEMYGLTDRIHSNRFLEKHITEAIDDAGNVRDNASRELMRIRRDIIDKSAALRGRLQRILRKVSDEELVTDEYVTLREGRLVLPVKVDAKRKIPGIIHGESQSGSTVFLEPAEIFDMNNEIAELTFAERREVERILRTLTEELGAEAEEFIASISVLQLADSLYARARYAQRNDCTEPAVAGEYRILLRDAYHPLLLIRLETVVPMSAEMDDATRAIVISGPNAGGKTVAMKTLGLITAMALSGIHPPAAECVVHPCNVFTDIGDQQSLENDLSTFSSHMSRIGDIQQHVTPGDVVLLDEIGTGTDPDEGGAIAAAILDHLLSRRAFVLATTHHSSLKIYAYETDGVLNAGMEFDTRTITPTYRFITGMPGNSYAFELIERLGFERSVLDDARARLGDERNRMTEIIGQLEESLAESRRMSDEHRRNRDAAEALRLRYEGEAREFTERKNAIIAEARSEARETLSRANSMIENAVREIRSGASNEQVKELRRTIEGAREELAPQAPERSEQDGPRFKAGDTVRLKGGTQVGELQFDPDEKGNVVVQFGAMRMRSTIDELEMVTRKEIRREQVGRIAVMNAAEAETRIDLRGMYADEAIIRLEQAITAAFNANVSHLDIIHGKGTGALRKRVHEYLAAHPGVASFRLGALTEGGSGLTIVELK